MSELKRYFVKGPGTVTHGVDGPAKEYQVGQPIDLNDSDARALLEAGAIQTQDPANGTTPQLAPTPEDQPTVEALANGAPVPQAPAPQAPAPEGSGHHGLFGLGRS